MAAAHPGIFGATQANAKVHAGDEKYFFNGTTWVLGEPVVPEGAEDQTVQ